MAEDQQSNETDPTTEMEFEGDDGGSSRTRKTAVGTGDDGDEDELRKRLYWMLSANMQGTPGVGETAKAFTGGSQRPFSPYLNDEAFHVTARLR